MVGHALKKGRSASRLAALALLGAAWAFPHAAAAEWAPTEPVEIMVHSRPGSAPDVLARFIQKIWQDEKLVPVPVTINNQPVISVGFAWLKQQEGNPHKLTVSSTSTVGAPMTGQSEVHWRELTPISLLMSEYIGLAVHPDSDINTGSEFIDRLKQDPRSLSIGFGGSRGNPNHTGIVLPAQKAGVNPADVKVVVYSSGAEARTAVLGKHIDALTNSASGLVGPLQDGQLRVLAIAAPERLSEPFQDVPTWKEQGYDVVDSNWRWIGGAGGLTDEQIAYWEDVVAKMVETDAWKEMVKADHAVTTYRKHDETLAFFEEQEATMRGVLDNLGLITK